MIASGKKTIEIRKTIPKLKPPFKCYVYCTMDNAGTSPKNYIWKEDKSGKLKEIYWNGRVIGEFMCRKIDKIRHIGTKKEDIRLRIVDENLYCKEIESQYYDKCCLTMKEIEEYSGGAAVYGWHISDLVIYEKQKELKEFIVPTDGKKDCCDYFDQKGRNHCRECGYFVKGNPWAGIEDDCSGVYDFDTTRYHPLFRPPQSWCYAEEILK